MAKDPQALKMGGRLFASNCSVCHGSDAKGAFGFPNLTDKDWRWGGDAQTIKASIMNGRMKSSVFLSRAVSVTKDTRRVCPSGRASGFPLHPRQLIVARRLRFP